MDLRVNIIDRQNQAFVEGVIRPARQADLKEAYRRFDPALPLDGELLAQYYVERPGDPVGKISKSLDFSDSSQHILVVGQRGVGKTTELIRLARSVGSDKVAVVHSLDHESIANSALGTSRLTTELCRQPGNAAGPPLKISSPRRGSTRARLR